ncbi:Hypp676 [Branchiostoma lanceolatum]|uniref:Hypp676 protein n=1 Tax=Branchiostoma lanceolatum TaxID=7740 RepID=A0A8J9VFK5_BRALA|nr:Hypp676 [Branchiostoma lanceolatum]
MSEVHWLSQQVAHKRVKRQLFADDPFAFKEQSFVGDEIPDVVLSESRGEELMAKRGDISEQKMARSRQWRDLFLPRVRGLPEGPAEAVSSVVAGPVANEDQVPCSDEGTDMAECSMEKQNEKEAKFREKFNMAAGKRPEQSILGTTTSRVGTTEAVLWRGPPYHCKYNILKDKEFQAANNLRQAKAGPRQRSFLIKDSSGNIISTEADCIHRWKEHFSQLLNHPPVPEDPTLAEEANATDGSNPDCLTAPVTPDEVKAALKKLKNGKAPGICNLTAEMLKAGDNHMIQWLTQIINHVWILEKLPDDWRRGIILPFWKQKGDQLVCSNHRGITLLSIPGKLFTRILLTRAIPAIRSRRRLQQAGFMPNRSTMDHISALRLAIEKAREYRKNRHLYIAFIDLRAAFDTVDHASLWKILRLLGAPQKTINLFRQMYNSAESCVRVNGKESEWFTINSGVRQGCVAAPDLFNCIDYLMTKVCERVPGVSFGQYNLADLEYADDTTLLADSLERLRKALTVYEEEAKKLGLSINWGKTELMHIGEGPDPEPLVFNSCTGNFVPSFKYLGSIISKTGDIKPEVNQRRAQASAVLQSLWKPLWRHRHRHITQQTKLCIYNSSVIPVLLYGSEAWPLNNTLEARLDGFDSRALRRIAGIRWHEHVSNIKLRELTKQPPASRLAAMRRIRWYGHVLRLPPEHPTRAMLDFDPKQAGWRRPGGAPRTRWMDVVGRDLRNLNIPLSQTPQMAENRGRWRGLVNLVGSTHYVQEDE